MISEQILDEPVLNFSTSIYRNPGDILAFLKLLNHEQVKNINHVYVLIDVNGFGYKTVSPEMSGLNSLRFETIKNITLDKIKDSFECITKNIKYKNDLEYSTIDNYGVLHKKIHKFKESNITFSNSECSDFYIESLLKIQKFCTANNIKKTFFTVPWIKSFPDKQQQDLEIIFNRLKNRGITFLNFQFYKELYGHKRFFSDTSHLNLAGLNILADGLKHRTGQHAEINKIKNEDKINYDTISSSDFNHFLYTHISQQQDLFEKALNAGKKELCLNFYDFLNNGALEAFISNAFKESRYDNIKFLLTNNRLFYKNKKLISQALLYAILSGNSEMVKDAILLGADINYINSNGETPLLIAVRYSSTHNILKYLIKDGANQNYINKIEDSFLYAESPFTLAAKKGDETYSILDDLTVNSPVKRYSDLIIKLSKSKEKFNNFSELSRLHDKYFSAKKYETIRVQLLNIPPSSFKKFKDNYILNINNQIVMITPDEKSFIESLSARDYLRNIVYNYLQLFDQNNNVTFSKHYNRVNLILSLLEKSGHLKILQ